MAHSKKKIKNEQIDKLKKRKLNEVEGNKRERERNETKLSRKGQKKLLGK